MIELKITNSAALLLLTERMKIELELYKRNNMLPNDISFESMSYSELIGFVESAAFDLVCMLPAEVLANRSNLDEILAKAIRSLSSIYHKEELNSYSVTQSKKLIRPLEKLISEYTDQKLFLLN